ncbi:poly(R)-hydroxyalkanoic acid synthase subunit PhaE [Arenicellales bacterium nBUS_45]
MARVSSPASTLDRHQLKSWDTARVQSIETSSATNIRQFYDDWIEAGEALFRERAVTKAYADQVGEWINAQVDLNLAFGMGEVPVCVDPRDLKAALTEAEAREAQLRSELEALKSRQKSKSARATSQKKAPSKAGQSTKTKASSKSEIALKKSRPKS